MFLRGGRVRNHPSITRTDPAPFAVPIDYDLVVSDPQDSHAVLFLFVDPEQPLSRAIALKTTYAHIKNARIACMIPSSPSLDQQLLADQHGIELWLALFFQERLDHVLSTPVKRVRPGDENVDVELVRLVSKFGKCDPHEVEECFARNRTIQNIAIEYSSSSSCSRQGGGPLNDFFQQIL